MRRRTYIPSVTKRVNEELISKANKLKFVGTATAGMDHVDQELMKERAFSLPRHRGQNKVGVAEYAFSAMMVLAQQQGFCIDKTVGIIGCGRQVGSYLAKCLEGIGIKVLLNDLKRKRVTLVSLQN